MELSNFFKEPTEKNEAPLNDKSVPELLWELLAVCLDIQSRLPKKEAPLNDKDEVSKSPKESEFFYDSSKVILDYFVRHSNNRPISRIQLERALSYSPAIIYQGIRELIKRGFLRKVARGYWILVSGEEETQGGLGEPFDGVLKKDRANDALKVIQSNFPNTEFTAKEFRDVTKHFRTRAYQVLNILVAEGAINKRSVYYGGRLVPTYIFSLKKENDSSIS